MRSHPHEQARLRYLVHPLYDCVTSQSVGYISLKLPLFSYQVPALIAIQLEVVCKDTESQIEFFSTLKIK